MAIKFNQGLEPAGQTVARIWRIAEAAQRRQSALLARADHEVIAANRSADDLGAAVFVEKDDEAVAFDHVLVEHGQEYR